VWPNSIVAPTRASTDLAVAPAQIALDRPIEQIGVLPDRAAADRARDDLKAWIP
jgi:hypothetical protein